MDYSLYISICFIPSIDACAITVAKKLRTEHPYSVDVISNKICRKEEPELDILIKGRIRNQKILTQNFTNMGTGLEMQEFAKSCMQQIRKWGTEGRYTKLYSRALWPASHIAAIVYKTTYPDVIWTADFSDPVLIDMKGLIRSTELTDDWYLEYIIKNLEKRGLQVLETYQKSEKTKNAYLWTELMSYILADKITFTNYNQMKFMIKRCLNYVQSLNIFRIETLVEIKRLAKEKSKIVPHPVLPKRFYSLDRRKVVQGNINIAYFGAFYNTRNVDDILDAVNNISEKLALKSSLGKSSKLVIFHVFTTNPPENLKTICKKNKRVILHEPVSYLESLKIMNEFDCLLVIDALVKPVLGKNPYLPSKFSDCMGSDRPIWLITEKGSTLDKIPLINNQYHDHLIFRSRIGDIRAHIKVLKNLFSLNGLR